MQPIFQQIGGAIGGGAVPWLRAGKIILPPDASRLGFGHYHHCRTYRTRPWVLFQGAGPGCRTSLNRNER